MRRNKTFIITVLGLVCGLWSAHLSAQADFRYYDQTTYAYYQEQDWAGLIPVAREALAAGYDYPYLRLRLGIAYYELGRYRQAAPHFREALAFNPSDGLSREYLYYSLLLGGQPGEARHYGGLPGADQSPLPGPAVRRFFTQGTWKVSDRQTEVRDLWHGALGIQHGLGRQLVLTHTLSTLQQQFVTLDTVEVGSGQGQGSPSQRIVELPYHFNQQEYDLRFQWSVPRGWILSGGWQTIWSDDAEGRFVENAWQGHLSKGWPHLLLTASGGYADFTVGERWQYGGSLVIYPRANTDWYWRAAATLLSGDEQQTWWTQQLGWRVAERAWVEGMFEWGEIAHYQDWTQGFLYNIAEPVHNRLAINWQQGFGKEHFLLLQYMWEKKASLTSGQTYRHHALTIGLSFNLR